MIVRGVVDAHLHSWDRASIDPPWLATVSGLPDRVVPAGLPADRRAAAAVFVEADVAPQDAIEEARWAQHLSGGIAAIVAQAPVELGTAVTDHLDALLTLPAVTGIRRVLQDQPDGFLTSPHLASGVRAVGDAGMVFDACVRAPQLPALLDLVRAAPGTTVIIDHLGKPPVAAGWGGPEADAWKAALRELAAEPSTLVKLSGLAPEAAPGALEPQVRPFLLEALTLFGPERAMVGSDWPVSARADLGYGDWFALVKRMLSGSDVESDAVLAGTACRVYRIDHSDVVS